MPLINDKKKRVKYKPRAVSKSYDRLVGIVLDAYLTSVYLIAIGNVTSSLSTLDPTAKRPLSLIQRTEFVCDVERAVKSVIKTDKEQDCLDQLLKEIAGTSSVDPSFSLGIRAEVVRKVGNQFERFHLSPREYFVRGRR
jgi:hypothetical protein